MDQRRTRPAIAKLSVWCGAWIVYSHVENSKHSTCISTAVSNKTCPAYLHKASNLLESWRHSHSLVSLTWLPNTTSTWSHFNLRSHDCISGVDMSPHWVLIQVRQPQVHRYQLGNECTEQPLLHRISRFKSAWGCNCHTWSIQSSVPLQCTTTRRTYCQSVKPLHLLSFYNLQVQVVKYQPVSLPRANLRYLTICTVTANAKVLTHHSRIIMIVSSSF